MADGDDGTEGRAALRPADDLFRRVALPPELRVLADRHPRGTWERHPNLGATAAFWLERHGMFRALGAGLADAAAAFREERVPAATFLPWFGPRFGFFLRELHGHHHVEDHHYFPLFRAADPRLSRGFDLLDADHGAIDGLIRALDAAGGALGRAAAAEGDAARARADLAGRIDAALPALARHLDDEEDLVIPLILERTEGGLGIA